MKIFRNSSYSVVFILGYMLGSVFLLAGLSKIAHFDSFTNSLPSEIFTGILSKKIFSIILIGIELTLGFELLADPTHGGLAFSCVLLLFVFLTYVVLTSFASIANIIGKQGDCSCFLVKLEILRDTRMEIPRDITFCLISMTHLYFVRRIKISELDKQNKDILVDANR